MAAHGEAIVDQLITWLDAIENPNIKKVHRIPPHPNLYSLRPCAFVYLIKARPTSRADNNKTWVFEIGVDVLANTSEDGNITATVDEFRQVIENKLDSDQSINSTCMKSNTHEWAFAYPESETGGLCLGSTIVSATVQITKGAN